MVARNKLEEMVLEMVRSGKPVKGWAREVLEEMSLRELEEKED